MRRITLLCVCIVSVLTAAVSCRDEIGPGQMTPGLSDRNTPDSRTPDENVRRVLLLYSCGFNSLSRDCQEDINDLAGGELPGKTVTDDVILVFSHHTETGYATPNAPVLFRLYAQNGNNVRDTLKTWAPETVSASSATLREVLEYVHRNFRAREYNLIFSSHATGWLPPGYYTDRNKDKYEYKPTSVPFSGYGQDYEFTFSGPDSPLNGGPRTRSLGETLYGNFSGYTSYQMELENFAAAIPMKLGSIMFDCCLMGGVETASALKDKCSYIVFSPAEILAEGYDYTRIYSRFFGGHDSNPVNVAEDFYSYYDKLSGDYRSATVSVVDCSKVRDVESCFADIYGKYGSRIRSLSGSGVQRYYRFTYSYFFDLVDVLAKAGVPQEELDKARRTVEECVIYKNATASFLPNYGGFPVNSYCGLSCYLPAEGNAELDRAYAATTWNKATGLLK